MIYLPVALRHILTTGMAISDAYKNIGQRLIISKGDVKQTNLLYKCPGLYV